MRRLPTPLKLFLPGSLVFLWFYSAVIGSPLQQTPPRPVRNVLVVTMDGMRWQEVFGGMTRDLLTPKEGGVSDAPRVETRFGAATPDERREKLMPFFWTTIAPQGQVFGDPSKESVARVTNGLRFSYPGYNEILSGFADPRINSNNRVANPNVTVLEWLKG